MEKQKTKYKYEWLENWFKFLGFVLIHDGAQNLATHELPERRFFTRKYQLWMNGKPVEAYVKFIYDRRRGECTDFKIYGRDSEGIRREQKMRME